MTPIEQIEQWVKDKPTWWRHSVRLALENGELDQDSLSQIYQTALMENQLEVSVPEQLNAIQQIDFNGHTSELSRINLTSLGNVFGVGALAENQTLNFGSNGLFIVYGDNGAGKSSYAGILKNACLTRGACPSIRGNVFEATNPEPSAEISVIADNTDEIHYWSRANPSSASLKAIRVFDTSSAHHYVNKEDALGFKPSGLNLLTELTKAINYVKAIVEEDTMPGNGLTMLKTLSSASPVANFINNLSAKSNETDASNHKASPTDLARIEPLRQEIAQDKIQTPETIKAKLIQQQELLNPLSKLISNALRYVGDKAFARLKELQTDYVQKQQQADKIKEATLKGLPLDTLTGINWQSLWEAAKNFIEQEPQLNNFPPATGDSCPLCLQVISEISSERLASLHKFLSDGAATNAKKAHDLLKNAISMISSQRLDLDEQKAALTEIDKLQPGTAKRVIELFDSLSKRQKHFTDLSTLPDKQESLDMSPLEVVNKIIVSISEQLETVKNNDGLTALIQKKQQELQLLEDKKFVAENFEDVVNNIRRYKIIEKMEAIKKQCNSQKVSLLSSKIYQQGVIEPLKTAFNNELQRFGFTRFSINVQTRNSGGHQQFKLAIADAGEPIVAKVASEGEQRCIAIAAFLAEMNADNRQSAVIFDDPVNSLSHQWSSKVAERLVAESHDRQVIVFTHDIVFFKLLLEQAEIQNADHASAALERSRRYTGLVRDNAPWEALTTSKRVKVLNTKLQELRRVDKDGTDTEFRQASRTFYGLLRESWERLVEEKLLNKVVNRFERGVYTQRLSRLVDISEDDIKRVGDAMNKCSTYFTGHDSAPAVGDPYPSIPEIEGDLQGIKDFLDQLQNQRRRT